MEEYITRAEFEAYKRQMEQRHTEEMKPIRLDVASKDVLDRLDELKQEQTQELKTVSNAWLDTLQENYTEHRADIAQLKESQADFRDALIVHGTRLDQIGNNLDRIVAFLEKQGMQ